MPDRQEKSWMRRHKGLAIAIAAALVLALWGIVSRVEASKRLHERTEASAIADVTVIKVASGPAEEEIILPGTVEAWHQAPIYARTNGYLKNWLTGMGTRVHKGDLLAEIDTPEVDAQLHQAEADLATAEANNQLAQVTAKRWEGLVKTNAVSKQEADEKTGAAAANLAQLKAAEANLNRLKELESFKRVVAPFDGVITSRTTDIGALITSGSTTGQILFRIAETGTLRIYVQVPQTYSAAIMPGLKAELHFAEHPGKAYPVTLYHSADAIEPGARTLLIEFLLDNQNGEVLPGGYTEVHLKVPSDGHNAHLPVSALIFRAEGLQAATVDAQNHVVLKSLRLARDYGKEVEVAEGIAPGETVIVNPPDSLVNGQEVHVIAPETAKEDKKP